jgi:hypothetical protein
VTFVEKLSEAQLEARTISTPPKPPKPSGKKAPSPAPAAAAPAPPPGPAVLTRTYVVRGVAKNGNLGAPAARVDIPLLAAPGPARIGDAATWDETSVTIKWNPPAATTDEAPGVLYNIYSVPASGSGEGGAASTAPVPLNPKPVEETSFVHAGAEPGKEQCFIVRSVAPVGTAFIEGDPSNPICVTPKDTFPPAAPKSLTAVADTAAVNLVWDSNSETDLAGYLVLRAEAPGDNMQPLMRAPIQENRYTDRTVTPGVAYFYTVIAVDKAGNRSPASNRVQETGR